MISQRSACLWHPSGIEGMPHHTWGFMTPFRHTDFERNFLPKEKPKIRKWGREAGILCLDVLLPNANPCRVWPPHVFVLWRHARTFLTAHYGQGSLRSADLSSGESPSVGQLTHWMCLWRCLRVSNHPHSHGRKYTIRDTWTSSSSLMFLVFIG